MTIRVMVMVERMNKTKISLWFFICLLIQSMNCLASQSWLKQLIAHKEQGQHELVITPKKQGFFNNHVLLFFYASTCPHCHNFAPVLKNWVNANQASLLALAFDNQPLPEFPNFKPATTEWVNLAYNGRPITYPALFVVNHQSKMLYPISFGALSDNELALRMTEVIEKIKHYEHREYSA